MTASRTEIEDQAAAWLVGLDSGTADPVAFEAWRDADPRHAVAYAVAASSWAYMAADPGVVRRDRPIPSRRRFLRTAGLAGGAVAASCVGLVAWSGQSTASAATRIGERRLISAGAGVGVELNTDSRIRWRTRDDVCRLWLEKGEISITIDGGETMGAALYCQDHEILLTDGAYVARLGEKTAEVLVLAGAARPRRQPVIGAAGERLKLTASDIRRDVVPEPRLESAVAWRTGEIVFDGEPLAAAVAEYNRYLTRKILIVDPYTAGLRVGGRFDTESPAAFLSALSQAFDLTAVETADGVVLQKNLEATSGSTVQLRP